MTMYKVEATIWVDDEDENEAWAHVIDMLDSYGNPGPYCEVTDSRCLAIERPPVRFAVGPDSWS